MKTQGHISKYRTECRVIFTVMARALKTNEALFSNFVRCISDYAKSMHSDDKNTFKGDMLEIFAELFFTAFMNDPKIGLKDYTPVPLDEDYGVDGTGINPAGNTCAVQVKYRENPRDLIFYADIARTYTSAKVQLGLDVDKSQTIYLFTSSDGANHHANHVLGDRLHVIGKEIIQKYVDNNHSFWLAAESIVCGV